MLKPAVRRFVGVALAVSCSIVAPCATIGADAVPPMVRQDIETVLKEKNRKLAEEKDRNGIGFKRGTYSKSLQRSDASTYTVAYVQDTLEAAPGNESDQLRTERFELTVKRDRAGKWAIAKEEKKDDVVGLYRPYFGVPWIYKFDSFSFEREGLKVSATNGYAYASKLLDAFSGFKVFAADLNFEFTPPLGTSQGDYYRVLDSELAKEHPGDLVFKPESLSITCDPTTCTEFMTRVFGGLKPDTGAMSKMREALTADRSESEKNKHDNPFANLQPPADPDHRYWSFTFKRQGMNEHFAYLSYDNFEPWQVSFGADGYGTIFAYYSEDMRGKINPSLLEKREDKNALDFDLKGIAGSVDLGLDDPTAMSGDVTFTLKIKRDLKLLPFFIARERRGAERGAAKEVESFVNSIQDASGNELTWTRLSSLGGMVYFPKPIPAGSVVKLRLQFADHDAIYPINPSFFGLSRQGWLPFVRFADFIESFDLTVRTRDRFTVVGIGKKLSDRVAGGIRTTRWTAQEPVSFPTIIFGDYVSAVSKHIVKKSDGTPIPVTVYVDKVSTNSLDENSDEFRRAAASGARDIRGKQLGPIAVQAAVAIELYEQIFGVDYPYSKLDVVGDPLGSFYGQAPSSIVYLGFGVFRGEGTVAAGLFHGGTRITKFNKDVVAHETAHQWWGSVVVHANERNYWFIESLAEVSSAIYVERAFGRKRYDEKVAAWRQEALDNRSEASVQDGTVIWTGDTGREAAANIYAKGSYVFHMLRCTFGDEKLLAFLKAMAQELQHKKIVTRDIQDIMEKVVGGNMDWFFDQWIRGVGIPQYALEFTSRRNEQGKWIVEGTIKQRVLYGKNREPMPGVFFRGVAPLTFVTPDGRELKSTKSILVQGSETRFRVVVAQEPAQVFFNKDGEILAEDTLINRSW
jgi:hypothetical protein